MFSTTEICNFTVLYERVKSTLYFVPSSHDGNSATCFIGIHFYVQAIHVIVTLNTWDQLRSEVPNFFFTETSNGFHSE
jgi:hypothetical protein